MSRLTAGGRIDRTRTLNFTFDGKPYPGHPGDTLASALLANDVVALGTSISHRRPRGIVSAGVDDATALVQLQTPFPEMVQASTVELFDGLVARGLSGRGALADVADPARYDSMHAHCDLLVVGAGPAGLQAALTAGRAGARVVLVDDQPTPGGWLLGTGELPDWISAVTAELASLPDVRVLSRTSAFGCYDDGFCLAVERRTDHLGTVTDRVRQRVWRLRARQTILATGAHERPIVFADNDRPGIMLAHAARTYLHHYGVLAGHTVVVFTSTDSGYPAAVDLAAAGAAVTVVDPRTGIAPYWAARCGTSGITLRPGQVVVGSTGTDRVTGALVGRPDAPDELPCDLLLVSGGWSPVAHLYSQARGRLEYHVGLGAFVPVGEIDDVRVAGAATGELSLGGALTGGATAAVHALAELRIPAEAAGPPDHEPEPAGETGLILWSVPGPVTEPDTRFVDLQRDATVSDILRATGAGLRSVEHIKRYTTIGTAHDQGKTSGLLAAAITAEALGENLTATTTFRPPYTSVAFATLAGADRGVLFDPTRTTAMHGWHIEHGAVFENVGQWLRPRYYPRTDSAGRVESMDEAVDRETRAARTRVAMMDASTLGKITVQGPDAAIFLDRLYTNVISTLRPGRVRYGVLCGIDGMILDDGTVSRVGETEFLLTTTTGNAGPVLDWLEEFAQTEWPELRVYLTSVTEHWVTIPLIGPGSRALLGALAPDLDVSRDGFGFMTWRDASVAGIDCRVARISFSGELAYELNVQAWYGDALWRAVYDAGQPYGLEVYGTEAMHVLRAEKGYPIIGQDTDGTVTPQDLGLDWVISKKKPDYVGRRSHLRAGNLRPDRKHLVGLLPADSGFWLAEGAQLIADPDTSVLPAPMLGHVTSSYRSAALGRSFALALLQGGRDRIGQQLHAWHDGSSVPVTVTGPVLYDPEGDRRDG